MGGFYHFSCKADRKDPTHSGHTDSVYYAHVKARLVSDLKRLLSCWMLLGIAKGHGTPGLCFLCMFCVSHEEQQAMQKQATELRRMKKRQRQMTPRHKELFMATGGIILYHVVGWCGMEDLPDHVRPGYFLVLAPSFQEDHMLLV